jgi:L-serine dehydratase
VISLLDIVGPVMVGPSSSHTAGACRLSRVARALLEEEPVEARFELHSAFAKTMRGHGTDRALAAGALGMESTTAAQGRPRSRRSAACVTR